MFARKNIKKRDHILNSILYLLKKKYAIITSTKIIGIAYIKFPTSYASQNVNYALGHEYFDISG